MQQLKDSVLVKVSIQGSAVAGQGYMLKRSENVAAFYIDGWGETGRIYPVASSSSVYVQDTKEQLNVPSLNIEDGRDDTPLTEIYFPEYEDWNVHSVGGGKVMAVCLVKEQMWQPNNTKENTSESYSQG